MPLPSAMHVPAVISFFGSHLSASRTTHLALPHSRPVVQPVPKPVATALAERIPQVFSVKPEEGKAGCLGVKAIREHEECEAKVRYKRRQLACVTCGMPGCSGLVTRSCELHAC